MKNLIDELSKTLNKRGADYGSMADVADKAADLEQAFFSELELGRSFYESEPAILLFTHRNIWAKQARLACGEPYHRDSWLDIAGYALKMVEYIDATRER